MAKEVSTWTARAEYERGDHLSKMINYDLTSPIEPSIRDTDCLLKPAKEVKYPEENRHQEEVSSFHKSKEKSNSC